MCAFSMIKFTDFSNFLKMLISAKVRIITTGRKEVKTMLVTKGTEVCVYCAGAGYLQLVLWGTETCPCCHGTGKVKNKR